MAFPFLMSDISYPEAGSKKFLVSLIFFIWLMFLFLGVAWYFSESFYSFESYCYSCFI